MYTYAHIYIYIYIYIYVYVCVRVCVRARVCVCVFVFVSVFRYELFCSNSVVCVFLRGAGRQIPGTSNPLPPRYLAYGLQRAHVKSITLVLCSCNS